MDTTPAQALLLLIAAFPISIWAAWSDMKYMRIPNPSVVALTLGFLVLGPIALPLDVFAWRLLNLVVVLVVGFLLSSAGKLGAGDAKFAAAAAPYIAPGDLFAFLYILAFGLLAAFATHRLFRALPAMRRATADWHSWTVTRDFPLGFALGGILIFYLGLAALQPA
ncbi:prepilin peptidase [Rhodovulum sp. YNF3179]|uniref:prepilin peptidase n=1 Tax=Rhodovulum sp. YNF3179 TaxID=3425127 RepID=UPI003D32C111